MGSTTRLRECAAAGAMLLAVHSANAQRSDTVVKHAGRPLHAGVGTLVQELSIGSISGADEYIFGEVTELAVANDGSIYVFDRQVPALRKYDANGKFVRTFARGGQGPGEYRSGGGLAIARDGRVLLWDTGNWRINVYSPAGDLLGEWPTPSGSQGNATLVTSNSLVVDTAGNVWFQRRLFTSPARSTVFVRLRPNGTALDTLQIPTFDVTPALLRAVSQSGNATSQIAVPFTANPLWALSPMGYFVTGIPNRYAFEFRIPVSQGRTAATPPAWTPGDPVISVRLENVQPIPVSAAEREEERKRIEENLRRTDPGWNWGSTTIPATKPLYANIVVANDGRIWLPREREARRGLGSASSVGIGGGGGVSSGGGPPVATSSSQAPPRPTKPTLFDVFNPDGTYVGQVQVPPDVALRVRRGDHVWGVEYDKDDVAYVKRFRIVWR